MSWLSVFVDLIELVDEIESVVFLGSVGVSSLCFFLVHGEVCLLSDRLGDIEILLAFYILTDIDLRLNRFLHVGKNAPHDLGILGYDKLLQFVYRYRLKLLNVVAVKLIYVFLEIEYGVAELPHLLALGRILLAEVGYDRLAACFYGIGDGIRFFVCLADDLFAKLLSLDKRGADGFLLVAYFVKVGDDDFQLALKFVVFAVKLGIFLD